MFEKPQERLSPYFSIGATVNNAGDGSTRVEVDPNITAAELWREVRDNGEIPVLRILTAPPLYPTTGYVFCTLDISEGDAPDTFSIAGHFFNGTMLIAIENETLAASEPIILGTSFIDLGGD